MTKLTIPTIHLNGSSKERLLEALIAACDKARELTEALAASAPNGRDYYPQGDEAYVRARREHESRLDRVHTVFQELEALAVAIDEGGYK